jgi:hypothetical protein
MDNDSDDFEHGVQLGERHQSWSLAKRRALGRERTRRYRARKADARNEETARNQTDPESVQGAPLTLEHCQSRATRISAGLARELVQFAAPLLKDFDSKIQQLTIQKFLSHVDMKDIVPPFLSDLETLKLQNSVISSVREGMRDHLVGSKPSKIVMAKDILCTFASGSQCGSGRGLAGLLGVDRRNIYHARSRRMVLDAGHDAFWLQRRRKIRSDSLSASVRDAVLAWWTEETTVSPNRKDVASFHEGLRCWLSHPTHYLQCSQVGRILSKYEYSASVMVGGL